MSVRKSITKKLRFEVFKRDSFSCQYCGESAPSVILHIDHIKPVAKGGSNDIANLITSCKSCNLGKSDRVLSDSSVVKKSKKQLDLVNDRRNQLKMMLEWQQELSQIEDEEIQAIQDIWSGYYRDISDSGCKILKSLIKKYSFREVYEANSISLEQYAVKSDDNDGGYTDESMGKAFNMIAPIVRNRRTEQENPDRARIYYIRGILRNRLTYFNNYRSLEIIEDGVRAGYSLDDIQEMAKECRNWSHFQNMIYGDN